MSLNDISISKICISIDNSFIKEGGKTEENGASLKQDRASLSSLGKSPGTVTQMKVKTAFGGSANLGKNNLPDQSSSSVAKNGESRRASPSPDDERKPGSSSSFKRSITTTEKVLGSKYYDENPVLIELREKFLKFDYDKFQSDMKKVANTRKNRTKSVNIKNTGSMRKSVKPGGNLLATSQPVSGLSTPSMSNPTTSFSSSMKKKTTLKKKVTRGFDGILDRVRTMTSSTGDPTDQQSSVLKSGKHSHNLKKIDYDKEFQALEISFASKVDLNADLEKHMDNLYRLYKLEKDKEDSIESRIIPSAIVNMTKSTGSLFDITKIEEGLSAEEMAEQEDAVLTLRPKLIKQKTYMNTWIVTKTPGKKPSTFNQLLHWKEKNVKQSEDNGKPVFRNRMNSVAFPTNPKEFLDPTVAFIEKQMEAWERMKREMMKSTGTKMGKMRCLADPVSILILLKELGLSPNIIMYRVDKSTLVIVLKIKLWKKKAMDSRSNRSAPIRKLIQSFNKELMLTLPVPIARSITQSAIEVMELCRNKYKKSLGPTHEKTLGIEQHIIDLQNLLPFEGFDTPIKGRSTLLNRDSISHRIYPTSNSVRNSISIDIEDSRRSVMSTNDESKNEVRINMTLRPDMPPVRGPSKRVKVAPTDFILEEEV